ncbi:hypothetical protein F4777DRAFT_577074 [Nemania sp. FL0916]|nr:hypothetical protein F4777DRAFT_577074 [Nemania sp. FL0916]
MCAAIISFFAASGLVSAHFSLEYPAWRADTLAANKTYSQWEYPCAGVPYYGENKTEWPMEGGSVALDLHHPWTYYGKFCIPALPVPATVVDGQNATLQVITSGQSGSALYNCADIVFRSSAKPLSSEACTNSTGITATTVGEGTMADGSSTATPTPTGDATTGYRVSVMAVIVALVLALVT